MLPRAFVSRHSRCFTRRHPEDGTVSMCMYYVRPPHQPPSPACALSSFSLPSPASPPAPSCTFCASSHARRAHLCSGRPLRRELRLLPRALVISRGAAAGALRQALRPRAPAPPSPPRRLTVVLHSQTSDASCLCFELADAKDRLKFKTRVAPLMTNCAVS